MLIYSPHSTSRLHYIAEWLGEQTGTTPLCISDRTAFENSEEIKINYSDQRISKQEIWIKPEGLLSQTGIQVQANQLHHTNHLPVLFKNESDLGFDYFSAAFYLISRYEEYLPFVKDVYGRFPHTQSIAYKQNFLQRPLVDEWTSLLLKEISMVFSETTIHPPSFSCTPTYDIDISWSYKEKGLLRNLGGALRDPKSVIDRIKVLAGFKQDPFDIYAFLEEQHESWKLPAIYFFLTAPSRSTLDKNIAPSEKSFRRLVQQTTKKSAVGIHPSVYSYDHQEVLRTEKELLESICHHPITKSRFHFLKCLLPADYRRLIAAGITDDYTMGYGTINGFRASTSRSFLWYDVEKEGATNLRIHPFCWMDANSCYEMKMLPEEAYAELLNYLAQIKQVNGTMMIVSHNHLLGENSLFKGWKNMYCRFLEEVSDTN